MAFIDGFTQFPELTTERLALRQLGPEDAAAYFRGLNTVDPTVWGLRQDSEEGTRAFLAVGLKAWKNKACIRWAITARGKGQLLGEVKLFGFEYRSKAEIGYWLAESHRRKGLGTEAVAAVVSFGLCVMELHRIEAFARPDNAASCGMLEKLGFQREGVLRKFRCEGGHGGVWNDAVVYGAMREEWTAR